VINQDISLFKLSPLYGFAPDGVYIAKYVTINAVSSYLAISTLPIIGGIFSVALSLRIKF